MDTDKTSTTPGGEIVDITENTDSFTEVKSKKCEKRKREQDGADMETETVVSKRPQFPPISGDKLKVSGEFLIKIKNNVFDLVCFHRKKNSFGTYFDLKWLQCCRTVVYVIHGDNKTSQNVWLKWVWKNQEICLRLLISWEG